MPKSQRLTLADVRAITRLLGECRELGDDALLWRYHFIAGAARLIDADASAGGQMRACLTGSPITTAGAAWGFEGGLNIDGLRIVWEWGVTDPFRSEIWTKIHGELNAGAHGITAARQQLIGDRDWDGSNDNQYVMRTMEAEQVIHSFYALPGNNGRVADIEHDGVVWFRARGGAPFSEREAALVKFMHEELARLVGGPLASSSEPSPSQLPPRARQVLKGLLEGDTDKQIAARLEVSPHTINQYTKQIFRHFRVAGRNQLLARWIRRGWSSAAKWDAVEGAPPVLIP
jgi:DNA-binding CsgD family transcriptional regulator